MQKIIVTDLMGFSSQQVSTAGVDLTTGQCVRLIPYLTTSESKKLNILPGAILTGEFTPVQNPEAPYQEDMFYKKLTYVGTCSSSDFKLALNTGLFDTVEKGFQIKLGQNQKYIPVGHSFDRSIITIKAQPDKVEVVESAYNPGKIKLNFVDNSGCAFNYMSLNDLGLNGVADSCHNMKELKKLNEFICSQVEVYLRIGLSSPWNNGKTDGYWMQVNGLYTFPDYHHDIRSFH